MTTNELRAWLAGEFGQSSLTTLELECDKSRLGTGPSSRVCICADALTVIAALFALAPEPGKRG